MWDGKVYKQHYAEWIQNWARVDPMTYQAKTRAKFTGDKYDAKEWAALAKRAGMKYAVLTTKHHEGFTLFNSKQPYSLKNDVSLSTNISAKGRDFVGEYSSAFRDAGLKVGYYYSLLDWQHPDAYPINMPGYDWNKGKRDHGKYVDYVHAHLEELLTGYGKIDCLWYDFSTGGIQGKAWRSRELLEKMAKWQPEIVMNNRLWNGLENRNADYATPEKYVPPQGIPGLDWEVCHTMNESFGYSAHDNKWKSVSDTVRLLCETVSKGGTLLLNVGPKADGSIPPQAVELLEGVGKWMDVHSEAIYGTTASPFAELPFDAHCTVKKGEGDLHTLYLAVYDWPANGFLELPGLKNKVLSAKVLAGSSTVKVNQGEDMPIRFEGLGEATNEHATVLAIQIKGSPKVEKASFVVQASDGLVKLRPSDAWVKGETLRIEGSGSNSNFGYWSELGDKVLFPFEIKRPGPVEHRGGDVAFHPGSYKVVLTMSCDPASGGAYDLTVAGQKFSQKVKPTANWSDYQDVEVGEITLKSAGHMFLSIEPTSVRGQGLMNLRLVKLVPTWKK